MMNKTVKPQLYEICFFGQFSCQMGNCPYTCCRGWRILFDEETYQRYLAEPGKTGFRLRSSIAKMDGEVYFRDSLKRCTYLEKAGTCQLQRVLGTDYQPLICRQYPRFWQHYGAFAEEALFLSCPEAARLFLEHLDDLRYVPAGREITYERWGTNEDEVYLDWLRELREAMIGSLWDKTRSRAQIFSQLVALMKDLQNGFLDGTFGSGDGQRLPDVCAMLEKHRTEKRLYISSVTTDQMLTNGFYHQKLRTVSPLLYRLCKSYFSRFDKLTAAQADTQTQYLRAELHRACPFAEQVLRGYMVYHLQLTFLEVYEDYSFLKKLAGGIIHMHLLELFFALYAVEKKSLTQKELAVLIAVYERRGRHNEDVAQSMYEKLYPTL